VSCSTLRFAPSRREREAIGSSLSLGERVDRDRRFHQPVSRRGRVRGHLHGAEGSKFDLEPLPLVRDEVEKEFDYNASGAAQIRVSVFR
jgi:hypothetical protein